MDYEKEKKYNHLVTEGNDKNNDNQESLQNDSGEPLRKLKLKKLNNDNLDINNIFLGIDETQEPQPLKKLKLKKLDDEQLENQNIALSDTSNNSNANSVKDGDVSIAVTNIDNANNVASTTISPVNIASNDSSDSGENLDNTTIINDNLDESFLKLEKNLDKLQNNYISSKAEDIVAVSSSYELKESAQQKKLEQQQNLIAQESLSKEESAVNIKLDVSKLNNDTQTNDTQNFNINNINVQNSSSENSIQSNDSQVNQSMDFAKSFHQELTQNVTNDILSNVKSDLFISQDENSQKEYAKQNEDSSNKENNLQREGLQDKNIQAENFEKEDTKSKVLAKISPKKISAEELHNLKTGITSQNTVVSKENQEQEVEKEAQGKDSHIKDSQTKKVQYKELRGKKISKRSSFFKRNNVKKSKVNNKTHQGQIVNAENEKSENVDKVDKVLQDVALLLKPFKDILLKTLPFLKPIINVIDKIAIFVGKIARVIMINIPKFIKFLKSRYFRIIVYVCIVLFLFGIFVSRAINSNNYVRALEDAIYDSSGYNVSINGIIKVRVFPFPGISIKNVFLYKAQNSNSALESRIAQVSAENVVINFKILPMFWGNFEIDKLSISKAVMDVAIEQNSLVSTNLNQRYEDIIKDINRRTTFKVVNNSVKKEKAKEAASNIDLLKKIDNVINHTDNIEQDYVEELQNDIITEGASIENLKDEAIDSNNNSDTSNIIQDNSSTNNDNVGGDSLNKQPFNAASALDDEDQNQEVNVVRSSGGEGFIYNILVWIVKNVNFDMQSVNNIDVLRSRINIVADNTVIASVENISGKIKNGFFSKPSSEGSFRFMNNNAFYKLKLNYNKDDIHFDFKVNFASENADNLNIIGKRYNNGVVKAEITNSGDADLLFVSHFIFPINLKEVQNHSFKANLLVDKGVFAIDNIHLVLNKDVYTGNFKWNLSKNINNAVLDLKIKTDSIDSYMASYERLNSQKISSYKSSNFDSFVETVNSWRNSTIDNFKFQYFQFILELGPTKLNGINIDKTKVNLLFNNNGKVYIENLSITSQTINSNIVGKIDLTNSNAMLLLGSNGRLKDSASLIGMSTLGQDFILKIANDNNNYNLKTKLVINNNKFVFNEINGVLGDRQIDNSYLVFLKRIGNTDVLINSNLKFLDFNDLINIYKYQTSKIQDVEDSNIDLFGMNNSFKLNINLNINKFVYKSLNFNKANIDIALNKSGIVIKKFEASGEHGGSVVASFVGDGNVMPVVAGHLNLNNYVLKLEETKGFIFNGKNIIGDLYLNGRFKFSGDSYADPFTNIDGELSFVKYERIKLNRFANTNGLYFTISEKTIGKKTNYLVNDAYGRVTIKNGILDFYPVVMLYIYGNTEYRGTFSGHYNFNNDKLLVDGMVDNANNINNQMDFNITGTLLDPNYNRKFSNNKSRSNVGIKRKAEIKPLDSKSYKVANNLNNKEDKNNFNNTYNKNTDDKEQYLRDNLYQNNLDNSLYNNNDDDDNFKNNYKAANR